MKLVWEYFKANNGNSAYSAFYQAYIPGTDLFYRIVKPSGMRAYVCNLYRGLEPNGITPTRIVEDVSVSANLAFLKRLARLHYNETGSFLAVMATSSAGGAACG